MNRSRLPTDGLSLALAAVTVIALIWLAVMYVLWLPNYLH